jgi:flagellar hook assembly protein FlgD
LVYNAAGQAVRTLAEGVEPAGVHRLRWDGKEAGPGIYFLRLKAGAAIATRRILLLR